MADREGAFGEDWTCDANGKERGTKKVVLGWYRKMDGTEKVKGKKRKTVLYWKRLLREVEIDLTIVKRLRGDRAGWKNLVMNKMSHLERWENRGERSMSRRNDR